jgi:hypothetical protein
MEFSTAIDITGVGRKMIITSTSRRSLFLFVYLPNIKKKRKKGNNLDCVTLMSGAHNVVE